MALAKKCSRCKKYYDHYPTGDKKQWNGVLRIHVDKTGVRTDWHMDLDFCPECMSEFDKFMINGGKFDDKD